MLLALSQVSTARFGNIFFWSVILFCIQVGELLRPFRDVARLSRVSSQ